MDQQIPDQKGDGTRIAENALKATSEIRTVLRDSDEQVRKALLTT